MAQVFSTVLSLYRLYYVILCLINLSRRIMKRRLHSSGKPRTKL
jgi:hypothetical protein